MAETIKFEIKQHIAVLSENSSGWKTELTVTQWGDKEPVFDIRSWNSDYTRCGKGKTLNEEELKALKTALSAMEL